MPSFKGTGGIANIGDISTGMKAAAWPYYCQCVPGSPSPIAYPPPQLPPDVQFPTAPSFSCDPANLCLAISRIETLLNQVAGTVGNDYALTTLLQRYSLPFAVIPGAFHSALTSFGSFPVPRLIGVQYQVDQMPPNVVIRPGTPQYIRDLGWIGLELAAGGVLEHRVTRQQEIWLPETSGLTNLFAWDLTPGTQITVRELYAEP